MGHVLRRPEWLMVCVVLAAGWSVPGLAMAQEHRSSGNQSERSAATTLTPAAEVSSETSVSVRRELPVPLTRGDLGWRVDFSDRSGMTIAAIEPDSIAARAGLRRGDLLMSIDGRRFSDQAEMEWFLRHYNGRQLPIEVLRSGRRKTVMVDYREQLGLQSVTPPSLGVALSRPTRDGLVISRVDEASPAFHADLRPGDVIITLNGRRYVDNASFLEAIAVLPPQQPVTVRVLREGQYHDIRVARAPRDELLVQQLMGPTTDTDGHRVLRPSLPAPPGATSGNWSEVLHELNAMRRELAAVRQELSQLRAKVDEQ